MNWKLLAVPVAAGVLYAGVIERSRLSHDHQKVETENSGDFRLRILHVSDLHMTAGTFNRWRTARWLEQLRAIAFDVVAFSGDLIDSEDGIEPGAAFLGAVAAGRPAFAVLGNHDYHRYGLWENLLNIHTLQNWGLASEIAVNQEIEAIESAYQRFGIELLNNRGRLLQVNGETLWVAGIDDPMLGAPNLNHVLDDAPRDVPRLLISHNPDLFPWAEMAGFDLILSGHTHGGQIRLPLVGPVVTRTLDRSLAAGLTRNHRASIHVSRGMGETIPLRFRCPVQATVVDWVGNGRLKETQESGSHGLAPVEPSDFR